MNYIITVIVSFLVLSLLSPSPSFSGLILSIDYEDGTFGKASKTNASNTSTGYSSICCDHSAQIVSLPARTGTKSVKMTLLPNDEGYLYGHYSDPATRAEFEKWDLFSLGTVQWYGFSVFIDPAWQDSTGDPNGAVMAQWHSNRESCDQVSYPSLSIRYKESTNSWLVKNDSDPNVCSTSTSYKRQEWIVGTAKKGVWVDWVVYAKWSYLSDGRLKIWKDGQLVVDKTGPNKFNNVASMGFLKWGVYKSWWGVKTPATSDKLIAYFDNLKIGDANSSYDEVAAPNNHSTITIAPPTDLTVEH